MFECIVCSEIELEIFVKHLYINIAEAREALTRALRSMNTM